NCRQSRIPDVRRAGHCSSTLWRVWRYPMKFEPIRPNPTLDVHSDPPEPWGRIAVVGGWHDADRTRRDWPHAAVVGPLRSPRGFAELLRNLLNNPQIAVVIWSGPDLTPGETTRPRFFDLWDQPVAEDLAPHVESLRKTVATRHAPLGAVVLPELMADESA